MPQFFAENKNISEDKIHITNISDIKHITGVLRCKKNDKLILSGQDGFVYEAEIIEIKPDIIITSIKDKYFSDRVLKTNITLAQSIIKSQKQDFVIQKATELGIKTIIPFVSRNTVVKFDSDKDKFQKVQRWQKIVYESSKQCRRGDIAEVKPISTFDEVLGLEGFGLKIVLSEREDLLTLKQALKDFWKGHQYFKHEKILLVIGPEGGWEEREIEKFSQSGFVSVSLGKMILRAETAAIAAVSALVYELE